MNVNDELKAIVAKKAKQDFGPATTLSEAGLDSLDVIDRQSQRLIDLRPASRINEDQFGCCLHCQ